MATKTVKEVAALGGVTVRTLHYYDEIGILQPSRRSEAGYRLYDDDDLARLHEILVWRSLGFPLDEVRALVDGDPNPVEALLLHRERLTVELQAAAERVARLDAVIRKRVHAEPLEEADLAALFDGFDPAQFAAEAEQRWGHTDAFQQAAARTRRYGRTEWEAIKAELEAIEAGFALLLEAGVAPDSPEARAAAEAHRAHLERWFYDCPPEVHVGLAQTYTADPRFARHYDARAPGLAAFVAACIEALHAPRARQL